ncbi:MAG: hypothetical protein AB7G13_25355 [Lautropia sp.]
MDIGTTVPSAFREDLGYLGPQDVQRLMASLVALGAEVFMLKAEVERLRRALEATGAVAPERLASAGSDAAFAAWLEREQAMFARGLLDPLWRATATAAAPSAVPSTEGPSADGQAKGGPTSAGSTANGGHA